MPLEPTAKTDPNCLDSTNDFFTLGHKPKSYIGAFLGVIDTPDAAN